jgi:Insertion element 4 transposase N-terminal/Transposase DDE domain
MLIAPSSSPPAASGSGDAADAGLRAELAERVLSGPGLWLDWLAELDRASLLEELLAGDAVGRALAEAPHGHAYDRTLTAKMTVACVLAGCLYPGEGYDRVLATAFGPGGLRLKPGTTTPTGPAFSKARALLGEQVMKRAFELDAARGDAEPGTGAAWKGLETTAIDGTTADLFSNDELADAFGVPAGGSKPQLRIVAHVRTGSRRWIAAAVGGYQDGENTLADEPGWSFRPGMINLADRGFFSMDRWLRFPAGGAHLAWRVKNGAESVPFKTLRTLPDGSELVVLHESDGMRARRRRDAGNPHAPRLPDTTARLVSFTITARTRSGRARTTIIRVLTTLLDHRAYPARDIAALYAERWQIEIGHRCCRSSEIRFSRLFSLSVFLRFSYPGLGWCPAGASVVAGRAVSALA